MPYPIKLPQSVRTVLTSYEEEDEVGSYFYLLYLMHNSGVVENPEQARRLVKEIRDQVCGGGLMSGAIEDAQYGSKGEILGLLSRKRGLEKFSAKLGAILETNIN